MGNVQCCEKDSALEHHQVGGSSAVQQQVHSGPPLKIADTNPSTWASASAVKEAKTADAPAETKASAAEETKAEETKTAAAPTETKATAAPKKDMTKKTVDVDSAPVQRPVPTVDVTQATNITLTLKICSARGLRKADPLSGSSDPFVRCSVNGSTRATFCTKVIPSNIHPIWNCNAEVSGLVINDVLLFEVFDKDTKSADDFLGKCELMVRDVQNGWKGSWSQEFKLADTGEKGKVATVASYLKLEVSSLVQKAGSANKAAKVLDKVPTNGPKVMVTIVGARNLRNADFIGASDPFCKCEIPTKPDCVLQTPMIKDDLNPKWNYTAQLANFEQGDCMNFTIFDEDATGTDLLGRCNVKYDEIMPKGKKITKKLQDSGKIAKDAELDLEFVVTQPR